MLSDRVCDDDERWTGMRRIWSLTREAGSESEERGEEFNISLGKSKSSDSTHCSSTDLLSDPYQWL